MAYSDMSDPIVIDRLIVVFFLALLLWVAVSDFRDFVIPNRLVLALVALYPAHVIASAQPVQWLMSVGIGVAVFLVGTAFFAFKAMGGGDVKLLGVSVMWAGMDLFFPFFVVVVVSGFVLALVVALRSSLADVKPDGGRSLVIAVAGLRHAPLLKLTIPYGVAIAAGGMYVGGRLFAG